MKYLQRGAASDGGSWQMSASPCHPNGIISEKMAVSITVAQIADVRPFLNISFTIHVKIVKSRTCPIRFSVSLFMFLFVANLHGAC